MYVFICMQPYIPNHFMEVYQIVFISIWVYGLRRHVFSAPFFYFSRESSKWVSLENIYQVAACTRVAPKGLQTDYIGKVIDDLFIYWGWGSLQKLKRFDFLFHVFMQLCAWSCTLCHTSNGLTVCSDATLLSIMWLVSIPKLVNMKEKSYLVICKPHYKTLWVFSHKSQGSWQCEITIVVSSIKCKICDVYCGTYYIKMAIFAHSYSPWVS